MARNKTKHLPLRQIIISCASLLYASTIVAAPAPSTLTERERVLSKHDLPHLAVATWNVEHLAFPIDSGCKPRTPGDIEKLKNYADSLQADIVALQEVSSIDAIELLFPKKDWQIFISERADSEPYICRESGFESTQQKVAYAVRRDINIKKVKSVSQFGLGLNGLRFGLEMQVETDFGEVDLLNVHMKSGCFVDDYSRRDSEACQIYAQQVPILEKWVDSRENAGTPYIVLGDFNHRLTAPYNKLTQQLHYSDNGKANSLVNTMQDVLGCHPRYPAPIDHILIGHLSDDNIISKPNVHYFKNMDQDAMLSDHCAISLNMEYIEFPLSTAVKWFRQSKEYRYLTTATYRNATDSLSKLAKPDSSWVVVMDVDETVLDNSLYQQRLDKAGGTFSSKTWAAWIAEEKAELVPGVEGFITEVLNQGGKLALITNRERTYDHHTWQNLRELGLPITLENTCLLGKASDDHLAIDGKSIINDKDLRRQQIRQGSARCFESENRRHQDFPASRILMQVGDNIEDFERVTQEDADIEAILSTPDKGYVLLPNPMYGSW